MGSLAASPTREVAFFLLSLLAVCLLTAAPLLALQRREAAFEFMKLPITLMSAGFRFEKWRILSVQSVLEHAALWHFKSLLTFKGGINSTFIARAMAIIHQLRDFPTQNFYGPKILIRAMQNLSALIYAQLIIHMILTEVE